MVTQVSRTEATQAEERTKHRDLHTGGPQLFHETARHQDGKESIEQQPDLHALSGPTREARDDVTTEGVVANDERADIDGLACAVDQFEQRVARLGAVRMQVNFA